MPTVLVQDSGPIRTLTLNRPERRNALTPEMQDELIAALESVPAEIKVLILTGAGESFCAGLDLSALQAMQGQSAEELAEGAKRIARMFQLLYELPIPTIAAVNGHAIAGGTGLATLCDFTLAVPEAKFGYTEVRIGFVPALVSAYLQLQVGEKRARDLLLTGRLFAAARSPGARIDYRGSPRRIAPESHRRARRSTPEKLSHQPASHESPDRKPESILARHCLGLRARSPIHQPDDCRLPRRGRCVP